MAFREPARGSKIGRRILSDLQGNNHVAITAALAKSPHALSAG
jgi:hypothetical protein